MDELYDLMGDIGDDFQVVDLGGGEEYFADDYDQVHCIHGSYIGYPGGADYICGMCEDGLHILVTVVSIELQLYDQTIDTCYRFEHIGRMFCPWQEIQDLAIGRDDVELELELVFTTTSYWTKTAWLEDVREHNIVLRQIDAWKE